MSGQIQDGDFTVATQDGAKQITLPLQEDGDYFCQSIVRPMVALAAYYSPIMSARYSYANLLKYSDDFSQAAAWTLTHTTAATGNTDPEGATAASHLMEDNTTNAHNAAQALVISSGPVSCGVLAQAGERSFIRLRLHNATDGDLGATVFNLATGAVVSGAGSMKKLLNGWYWCKTSGTATVTNSSTFVDLSPDGVTFSYAGTTGSGVYLFHATAIASVPSVPWPAFLTTASTRTVTCPSVDPDDPIAFLVAESEPSQSDLQYGVARWSRKYSRISIGTTIGGSISVSKPTVTGVGYDYYRFAPAVVQSNTGELITSPNTYPGAVLLFGTTYGCNGYIPNQYDIYGPLAAITTLAGVVATGGTFTITYKANTTGNLNWNDSGATIATAVNALASIIADGITVSCTNNLAVAGLSAVAGSLGFTASAGTYAAVFSMNSAGLTPATASVSDVLFSGFTAQTICLRAALGATAHGFTNTGQAFGVFQTVSSVLGFAVIPPGNWSVADANTILIPRMGLINSGTTVQYAAPYKKLYGTGTSIIRATISKFYYMVNLSPGVTSLGTIPVPAYQGDTNTFLNLVFGNTGTINYQVGTLAPWDEPIYAESSTVINATDV